MENFIIYMVKACVLMVIFFLAYYTLLRKETFFNSNRWFLLAGLFTAVALPLIVYTKTIWVEPAPVMAAQVRTISLDQLMHYRQLAKESQEETISINWFDVVGGMYLAGVLLFLIRFVLDFLSIRRMLSGVTAIKDGRFRLIDTEKAHSPFSFFNYIVYNSAQLKQEELEGIIVHEKVHSSQKHSLDMIISQLFCIAFWFNPFVWLYKKSISQNLEFIADAGAMKLTENKQAYQKTLLKITLQPDCIGLTNHFYQSLIKKRIVMLNKQQSKKWNSWKYATVLPLLAAFMLLFQVKVVAQEKGPAKAPVSVVTANEKVSIEINKDTKDSELEDSKKTIKEEFNADVNFENVTRNLDSEITAIKVTVKDKGQSQVYEVAGDEPISPFTIEVEKNNSGRNLITFGTGDGGRNFVMARAFRIDGNDDAEANDSTQTQSHRIIRSYGSNNDRVMPVMPGMPAIPPVPAMPGNKLMISNANNMLIVVNGVKQKKGDDAIKLPAGHEIAQMNILSGKDAKKKYGKEAREGAVEITTKRGNNMAFAMGPEVFSFDMEPREFNFDAMPDFDIRIEDFNQLKDMGKIFEGDDVQIWGNGQMSEEEMKRVQEELKKAQIELEQLGPRLKERVRSKEMNKEELKAAKEEIEKAKKEIEESRKELENSRKELEKARKQLNKKA